MVDHVTFFGEVRYEDHPGLDAFGRLRTTEATTVHNTKLILDKQPYFWDEKLESGFGITSTHSQDTASVVLQSTLNTAGLFTRQTFQRFDDHPGKAQTILMTGVIDLSGGGTGVTRRIGFFDDGDGLYFQHKEGVASVVLRSSVTGVPLETIKIQTEWNVDKMDGFGPSGVDIDWTKAQLFHIDFQYGVGRVRMAVVVGGRQLVVHEFLSANLINTVYMSTPNLPLRYQMETTASSPASSMSCIGSSVIVEGTVQDVGTLRSFSTENTPLVTDAEGVIFAMFAMRLQSARTAASVKLRTLTLVEQTMGQQAKVFEYIVLVDPDISGAVAFAAFSQSSLDVVAGNTSNIVTGGRQIGGGHVAGQNSEGVRVPGPDTAIRLGASISGVSTLVVLGIRPIAGTIAMNMFGSISWTENP